MAERLVGKPGVAAKLRAYLESTVEFIGTHRAPMTALISTLLWGVGTLLDAVLRVLMAYTLPIDLVPALGTALYVVTSVVLVTVTNIYYHAAGVYDRRSAPCADTGQTAAENWTSCATRNA